MNAQIGAQMVLDAGRIVSIIAHAITDESVNYIYGKVEFDTPAALLGNTDGALRALIDGSGDEALLYSMAQGTSATSVRNCGVPD